MPLYKDDSKFVAKKFEREKELEDVVVGNSDLFFGKDTIYIDAKKKIGSLSLGKTIPDGFLFDLRDMTNPDFYLVEIELSSHDFLKHIFPQITRFFAFYNNRTRRAELVEKIFSIVNTTPPFKRRFKKYLGEKEVYKFIKDLVDDSQNILLLMDGDIPELPEIMGTYTDTWGKMVKRLLLEKSVCGEEVIYRLEPDFESLEYIGSDVEDEQPEAEYTEEMHLERVSPQVKDIYHKVKDELLTLNPGITFNPTKYYISIKHRKNVAYFRFRKKKIRLVVMIPEDVVKSRVKHYTIRHLAESVQNYYNGPSCELIIESIDNLDEVIDLLRDLVK